VDNAAARAPCAPTWAAEKGHGCLGKLAQGTLCAILNEQEIKRHKAR